MATIQSTMSLNDRMSTTLSSIVKAMHSTISTMQSVNKENGSMSNAFKKAQTDINNAEKNLRNFNKGLKDTKNSANEGVSALGGFIARVASFAAIAKGMQGLMHLSDTYTQTNARLNMMNDGLQTTAQLQDYIYESAQRSRVSYQSMADIVSKLGNQAGEAFGNSSKQVIAFSELLNKLFTSQGMDTNAIDSVMYNMTQSLSSGKLLGQDYRILKQNAPQMIKYLEKFYGVNRAGLDEMVSKGKVTADGLKNAIFSATDDINNKFNQMPMTFSQVWTKFTNSLQKIAQPILTILSMIAGALDKVFTFLGEHQYILYIIAAGIGILVGAFIIYNVYQTITTIYQTILNSALLTTVAIIAIVIIAILAIVGVLFYFWNTNDGFAEAVIAAWDGMKIGMMRAGLGIKAGWYGVLNVVDTVCSNIAMVVQNMVNGVIKMINTFINALNSLPGVSINAIQEVSFGSMAKAKAAANKQARASELAGKQAEIDNLERELNASRKSRVANRKKIGMSGGGIGDLNNLMKGVNTNMDATTGGAGTGKGSGGKAVKTTSTDKNLFSDEDIQLLLDVATRDYKLNYQQITPNVTVTFGDVRETADVDNILDQVADKLEEIYDGNLGVV